MTRQIPDSLIAQKNQLEDDGAWLFLFEIFVDNGNNVVRIVNNEEVILFDSNGDGIKEKFHPFTVGFEELVETSKGDLPTFTVNVSSVTFELTFLLEQFNGLRDERLNMMLVHASELEDPTAKREDTFRIRSSTANSKGASLTLAPHSLFDVDFPFYRFGRRRCRFPFGSEACGWGFVEGEPGINPPAGVTPSYSCTHLLKGPNGCEDHGRMYSDAGVEPLHPKRFGAQPLIPKRRGP